MPAVENNNDKIASSPSLVSPSRLCLLPARSRDEDFLESAGGEEEEDEEEDEEEEEEDEEEDDDDDEEEDEEEEEDEGFVFERFLAEGAPRSCSPPFFVSSSDSDSMVISPPTSLKMFEVSALPCLSPNVNKSRISDWLK